MKRTTETLKAEISLVNPNIEILGLFVKMNEKIECRCNICGNEWKTLPKTLVKGVGCPQCGKKKSALNKRKSIESLQRDLEEKCSNIEYFSGEYQNTDSKLFFKCKLCGNIWETTPHSVLRGAKGCPKCSTAIRSLELTKTHSKFLSEMSIINPNIEILSEYINDRTKIKYKCLVCGNILEATPNHLLKGHGCKQCGIIKRANSLRKTLEEFINLCKYIYGDRFIYDKVEYIDSNTKVLIICKEHGEFYIRPSDFLRGHCCPKCTQSFGENLIFKYLNDHNINFKSEFKLDKKHFNNKRTVYVDFITKINSQLYIIEYNGVQHYKPVEYFGGESEFIRQQERDCDLRSFCVKHNITLIEIPYTVRSVEELQAYLNVLTIK